MNEKILKALASFLCGMIMLVLSQFPEKGTNGAFELVAGTLFMGIASIFIIINIYATFQNKQKSGKPATA